MGSISAKHQNHDSFHASEQLIQPGSPGTLLVNLTRYFPRLEDLMVGQSSDVCLVVWLPNQTTAVHGVRSWFTGLPGFMQAMWVAHIYHTL